jgi:hypothetical protein
MGLGSEHSKTSKHSEGSGNLDGGGTVAQKHRGLMGLRGSSHETRATKTGLPAPSGTRPEGDAEEPEGLSASINVFRNDPSGLNDMGTPLVTRGISQQMVGDDANIHPSEGQKPARLEGPAEDSGNQRATSFGNRYPGARSF